MNVNASDDTDVAQLLLLKNSPTLGFENLLADFIFLRFLQYFGDDSARVITGYSLSADFFAALFEKDPYFTETYLYLFSSVSLYAGQPEKAIELVESSLNYMTPEFPRYGYFIWRNKAIDELLFLNDPEKAIESLQTAIAWAEQSPNDPQAKFAIERSRGTIEALNNNPDSRIARALAWSSIIDRAVDETVIQRAQQEIEQLGGEMTILPGGGVRVFLPKQD